MKKKSVFLLLPLLFTVSCAAKSLPGDLKGFQAGAEQGADSRLADMRFMETDTLSAALDELAELERSGGFAPGLGLAESKLREEAGDYAGAVLAVYKELSWAYALGAGDLTREGIRQGLEKLLEPQSVFSPEMQAEITAAVKAILTFFEGRYDEAEKQLAALYGKDEEADSFSRFLLLSCALETGNAGRKEYSAYGSIRSRYAGFPEYWYRFARYEEKNIPGDGSLTAHAERCINLAPEGPYAAECRIIFAKTLGLKQEDAPVLKTRAEIEAAVAGAVNQRKPELLSELLPLASLPDNPSTLYASGAMRALAGESLFRSWFLKEAEKARGRLAERLLYISRG
ncbi:MAG: hypothetical protein LBH07_05970 [Treponema sp.]|nr:hypothetical protein [Treponema sp.]